MRIRSTDDERRMDSLVNHRSRLVVAILTTFFVVSLNQRLTANKAFSEEPAKRSRIEPAYVQLRSGKGRLLDAVRFNGNKTMSPSPVKDAAAVRKYIKAHWRDFPGYKTAGKSARATMEQRAAQRLGEERVFEALRKQVEKYVEQQRRLVRNTKRLEKELTLKIAFNYDLPYRYLLKTIHTCRSQNVIRNGKRVQETLIKNVEFIRPARPK